MDCSMPVSSVLHCLLEFAEIHGHGVTWCYLSHRLLPPSPFAFNLSLHQGLFQWICSSDQVAKSIEASTSTSVLPMNIQGWFTLGFTGLISLQSKGLLRVISSTTVWKHQFFGAQLSLWFSSHICARLQEKP